MRNFPHRKIVYTRTVSPKYKRKMKMKEKIYIKFLITTSTKSSSVALLFIRFHSTNPQEAFAKCILIFHIM